MVQVEQVAHAAHFCGQIDRVFVVDLGGHGDSVRHGDAKAAQVLDFGRVVGEQADGTHAQIGQNQAGDAVFPLVGLVAQGQVGVHGVVAVVLQVVGPQLAQQPNASTFLAQIEQHALAFYGDLAHGFVELRAAIAAQGAKYIPGEALGMHPNQHIFLVRHIAHHQGQVLFFVLIVAVITELELTLVGGDAGTGLLGNCQWLHKGCGVP